MRMRLGVITKNKREVGVELDRIEGVTIYPGGRAHSFSIHCKEFEAFLAACNLYFQKGVQREEKNALRRENARLLAQAARSRVSTGPHTTRHVLQQAPDEEPMVALQSLLTSGEKENP